jgi:outer membrane protein assembly factor BamE (lipoprotein component of BamABCDE complex)
MVRALLLTLILLLGQPGDALARMLSQKEVDQVNPGMSKEQIQKRIGQSCDSRAVDGGDIRHFYKADYEGSKAILVLDFNPSGIATFKTSMTLDGVQYMPEYKSRCW